MALLKGYRLQGSKRSQHGRKYKCSPFAVSVGIAESKVKDPVITNRELRWDRREKVTQTGGGRIGLFRTSYWSGVGCRGERKGGMGGGQHQQRVGEV
jgi:hypothetical protein